MSNITSFNGYSVIIDGVAYKTLYAQSLNDNWKVYKLTSPNGRDYIGCTKLPLNKRWENGRNYKHNKELFDDIIQYGWNSFKKEILAVFECESDARNYEHDQIQQHPNGYNIYRGIKGYVPTGNPRTPSKQVMCVETKKIYSSIHTAAKETGLSRVKISECCSGKRKRTGGYHWKYTENQ
jgi:hypothetical protein